MPKSGPRQARIDPVYDVDAFGNETVSGWLVIDITQPSDEVVVSRHDKEADAIKAAEAFEQEENPGSNG